MTELAAPTISQAPMVSRKWIIFGGRVLLALLLLLLRRSPRVTDAVEPYIMATMGIPKYALAPWLILWFGIGDMPKLVVVVLMVFYIVFITTSSGIRAVDQRLIDMARIVG